MSQPLSSSKPRPARRGLARVHSIHFGYRNSGAIELRDHLHHNNAAETPEWNQGRQTMVVAYPGGASPSLRVVFEAATDSASGLGRCRVSARGVDAPFGLAEKEVDLSFNDEGLTDPIDLPVDRALPSGIGTWEIEWNWVARRGEQEVSLGSTSVTICTTWKPLQSARLWLGPKAVKRHIEMGDDPDLSWTYPELVRWTCRWAAGRDDPKDICDAIIGNLAESGLKYAVRAWNVRDMLIRGGGFCAGWYRMFQAMAAVQGIALERRAFLVDSQTQSSGNVLWEAIVVPQGGVGNPEPIYDPYAWNDASFKEGEYQGVHTVEARRYAFWGDRVRTHADGHCINFLEYRGKYVLYDPSFATAGIELDLTALPQVDLKHGRDAWTVGNFKEAYLDEHVRFMLGSIKVGQVRYEAPDDGLTVTTVTIDQGDDTPPIPFYWGP